METTTVITPPAEAGFSTNLFLNHPAMGRVQFTFRGATSQDWGTVLSDLDNFLHFMKEKGWTFDGKVGAITEAPQTPQAPSAPKASAAPAPKVETSPVDTAQTNSLLVKKVKVEPQADGKVKLHLFAEGHKYADLYITRSLDAMLKILENTGYQWSADFLGKVAEYDMSFYADWKNSDKTNSKGNPYKDVIALRSLEATA